jgi:hypothetical protein
MYAPPHKLPLPKVIHPLTDRKKARDVGALTLVADPADQTWQPEDGVALALPATE